MDTVSRRSFLAGACALVALGGTALPAAAESSITRLRDGRLSVRVGSIPALASVGGAVSIGKVGGKPVGVARTGSTTYIAFSLRCPHQGATVMRSEDGWLCPEHGSEFKEDGRLVLGPATRGLASVPVRFKRGRLIVGRQTP